MMLNRITRALLFCIIGVVVGQQQVVKPVVIATWFKDAVQTAFNLTAAGYSALDAVEVGCAYCEVHQCDGTVGWGGSPDTTGETTLDAIIMDAETHDVGAVTDLRRIREAVSTARKVLHYSGHTLLAGESATEFAKSIGGYTEQSLSSNSSNASYTGWVAGDCQPNFYANVYNQNSSCPPYTVIPTPTYTPKYTPLPPVGEGRVGAEGRAHSTTAPAASAHTLSRDTKASSWRDRGTAHRFDHDTIGMCILDNNGSLAGAGSSNGASHKIAGRSSDISMVGAGLYVDRDAGCAAATGDGDITSRFLPAYQAVEFMRQGIDPQTACELAVRRVMSYYSSFALGLVCLSKEGGIGAAGHGWVWTYAVADVNNRTATVVSVQPIDKAD